MRPRIVILCLILGLALWGCTKSGNTPSPSATQVQVQETPTLNVYYFHRTIRCPSCEKIEAMARQAVEDGFAGELATGRMQWRVINIDEPRNRHFEDDYRLQMQSVIVSEIRGGKETRWKNLEKVWDMLDDDTGFIRYVQSEIRGYVQGT